MAVFRSRLLGAVSLSVAVFLAAAPIPTESWRDPGSHKTADVVHDKIVLCAQNDSVGAGCGRISVALQSHPLMWRPALLKTWGFFDFS